MAGLHGAGVQCGPGQRVVMWLTLPRVDSCPSPTVLTSCKTGHDEKKVVRLVHFFLRQLTTRSVVDRGVLVVSAARLLRLPRPPARFSRQHVLHWHSG